MVNSDQKQKKMLIILCKGKVRKSKLLKIDSALKLRDSKLMIRILLLPFNNI